MAPISLNSYLDEAKSLIQAGNLEPAQEILHHLADLYPQHIALQRLRGELALAHEDFAAAAEHFQRVLELDPEEATAHWRLASLLEEDDVPAAIEHLERAWELDPGNQDLRQELARLYTLRDGEEPKRIDLTKAAFARLLVEGREFAQAADELRVLLAQDPQRIDLQILLARALFSLGRSWEAAEICQNILSRFPFSLPALLILGAALQRNGLSQEAQPFLGQAHSLDPENKRGQALFGLFGPDSPLPLREITVPRIGEEMPATAPPLVPEEPTPQPRAVAAETPLPTAMEEAAPVVESPELTPEPARPMEEYLPGEEQGEAPPAEEPVAKPPLAAEEVSEEMAVAQPPVEPIAEELLVAREPRAPLEEAEDFFTSHPDDPQARLNLARLFAQQENLEEALVHYRALFDAGPHFVFQVIADLEQLAGKSDSKPLQQLLGDAYMVTGRVPEALAQYQKLR